MNFLVSQSRFVSPSKLSFQSQTSPLDSEVLSNAIKDNKLEAWSQTLKPAEKVLFGQALAYQMIIKGSETRENKESLIGRLKQAAAIQNRNPVSVEIGYDMAETRMTLGELRQRLAKEVNSRN